MTRKAKIAIGAAVILAAGAAAAVAHRGEGWRHHKHHGMGHAFGFAGPMGHFCRGNPAEKADHTIVRIEHRVKPTDAQKVAFEELKTALRSAAVKVGEVCKTRTSGQQAGADTEPKPITVDVPARLADMETRLAGMLDAVKTVRPPAEAFYALLDDAQKKAVSELHPRGWGDKKRRDGHHKRDRDGSGRAPTPGDSPNP